MCLRKIFTVAALVLLSASAHAERLEVSLSPNRFPSQRVTLRYVEERFVTLRAYGVGQREAESMFRALEDAVRKLGVPVSNRLREYTVFDSNVDLDSGWLTSSKDGVAA